MSCSNVRPRRVRPIATDGEYTVVLDATLDDALRREGVARDAINLFNTVRKDQGFEVSDRVRIGWATDASEIAAALDEHADLVSREILAVEFVSATIGTDALETELGGAPLRYVIARAD